MTLSDVCMSPTVNPWQVDEELRVFRFSDAGEELEGELEEFTSFDGIS